jgi:hypothetical protein
MSFDSVDGDAAWREPLSDWPPCGENWREFESEITLGLTGATIQAKDPAAAAERWSMLLDRPAVRDGDVFELALENEVVRIVPPVDEDGTGVVGVELVVNDVAAVMERARALNLETADGDVLIGGVTFHAVEG